MNTTLKRCALATAVTGLCLSSAMLHASSHREAPFITEKPKVDGTDFYMFRSYEDGRRGDPATGDNGFVTMIANYLPLQDSYGGPNYFDLDDDAIYEIHIDWSGDGQENLTFQFDFEDINQDLKIPVGDGLELSAPLKNIGQFATNANPNGVGDAENSGVLATRQSYTMRVIQGDRRTGAVNVATNVNTGGTSFRKPMDNIGQKSAPEYNQYADEFVHEFSVANCSSNGRVFVGQRRDAFAVNLGEVFDLVNITGGPVASSDADRNRSLNELADKNVTSIAVEVPTDCLTRPASQTADGQNVIGGWTTASVRQVEIINPEPTDKNFNPNASGQSAAIRGGAFTQVSRLGMPLVNEVVVGLKDKDTFNHSEPTGDGQFLDYVTNPTLPVLLNILFNLEVPATPRNDLVAAFLTGLSGLNQPEGVTPSEMLRLNTDIAPKAAVDQGDLGALGGEGKPADPAGFPNGRRPVDDVVDISLRVAAGALLGADDPNNGVQLTDGAIVTPNLLLDDGTTGNHRFPYLAHPLPGSPFGAN